MNEREKLTLALEVYEQKLDGVSDSDIRDVLQVGDDEYQEILRFMHTRRAESEALKSSEQVFSEYCLEQRSTVRQLDELVEDHVIGGNALISALRLRKDIVDGMLVKGQELGVYEKKPKQHEIIGGLVVADLTPKELKANAQSEMKALKKTIMRFGDGDIKALPVGDMYDEDQEVVEAEAEVLSEEVVEPKKPQRRRKKTAKKGSKKASRRKTR